MPVRSLLTRYPHQARARAIIKTMLYRVFMLAITVTIAFVVTDNVGDALSIGLAANVLKTVTYYVYERAWDRVTWGVSDAEADAI